MTDYQVLFLIMTFMAIAFMLMADHYYTKYKKLLADVNRAAMCARTFKGHADNLTAQMLYWKERAEQAEEAVITKEVDAVERFYQNCQRTS